jgi:hypothetical protein
MNAEIASVCILASQVKGHFMPLAQIIRARAATKLIAPRRSYNTTHASAAPAYRAINAHTAGLAQRCKVINIE